MLLGQAKLGEAVIRTRIPGFELVPAVVDLSAAEIELVEKDRAASSASRTRSTVSTRTTTTC